MLKSEDWNFIVRKKVSLILISLLSKPMEAKVLASKTNTTFAHTNLIIKELEKRDLICITKEKKMPKQINLTKKGNLLSNAFFNLKNILNETQKAENRVERRSN